jgi:hypothetical protein
LHALAAEPQAVGRLPEKMSFSTLRASGLAASATLAIGAGSAVGLLAVSDGLHLRSPHSARSETLGWASFVVALFLVSLPSWALRRASVVRAANPAWICLLALLSFPVGYCVVHFGPSWFNSDLADAVVTMALASVAYSAGVAGLIAARRGQAPNPFLSYVLCGGFAFVTVGLVAWAILFLK